MNDTAKTTLWLIIIIVIVGGIWWFIGSNPDQQLTPASVGQVDNVQATTTPTPAPVVIEDASTSISIKDKTDQALAEDLNKIDSQLKILSSDSAK